MEDTIGKEKVVHGREWGTQHGGYFADPGIARPMVDAVRAVLSQSPADIVVDLGGGTGFLLSELASNGVGVGASLVNVDCSNAQLSQVNRQGITPVATSINAFRRGDAGAEDRRFFFMMRSVIHYVGEAGVLPLLRRLRGAARDGEFFVHQTASFDNAQDAACLNALYGHMNTRKWYPTADALRGLLADAGWRVTAVVPAPPLLLKSEELARRYDLDPAAIARIRDVMAATFGEIHGVFRLKPSGFDANLHYKIYTCVAGYAEPFDIPPCPMV